MNQFSKPSLDVLLNSKALALDFETTEWKKERISESDKELSKEELIKKYDLNNSLESLTNQALLDLAEDSKDESRNERIVTATLCNVKNDRYYLVSTLPLKQK